ncbi:MAG: hypothetical protein HYY30_02245 [Chloroflexi bacterium]|nr:hypothetical protein [Chloroflexota bacterium]
MVNDKTSAMDVLSEELEGIHRQLAMVSEEEVLAALNAQDEPFTASSFSSFSYTVNCDASGGQERCEFVSTQTA